jgi:hypothetical protein
MARAQQNEIATAWASEEWNLLQILGIKPNYLARLAADCDYPQFSGIGRLP